MDSSGKDRRKGLWHREGGSLSKYAPFLLDSNEPVLGFLALFVTGTKEPAKR